MSTSCEVPPTRDWQCHVLQDWLEQKDKWNGTKWSNFLMGFMSILLVARSITIKITSKHVFIIHIRSIRSFYKINSLLLTYFTKARSAACTPQCHLFTKSCQNSWYGYRESCTQWKIKKKISTITNGSIWSFTNKNK